MTRPAPVVTTERLALHRFVPGDAPLILELLNDPAWLRFIGDRKVHSLAHARRYLSNGPIHSYSVNGFGLYRVERRSDAAPVGMCGLVKRDSLPDVDLGFALLERHRGHGYAEEAARATLHLAHGDLGFERIVAIVSPDNERSAALLRKIGFTPERRVAFEGRAEDPVDLWAHHRTAA